MDRDTIDSSIIEKLETLSDGDLAAYRTNPVAVVANTGNLITADEVKAGVAMEFSGGLNCPKCNGRMRYYVSKNGTPYFAHASARGSCPAGHESPAHLCIKRGLHSVGFECEVADGSHEYRWDAIHPTSGVVVEVVCSGLERYRPKIAHATEKGIACWWLLDSAARGLCSRSGSERICLASFAASGTIVVEGLFHPKVSRFFSAAGEGRLFAFYLGLVWRCIGEDRWQLLDESHALSQAAVAEDGIKHLMVKMHIQNSHVVTENKRRGIDRKTWFDKTFRFRGQFSMAWGGDRDYVIDMVRQLVRDVADARSMTAKTCRPYASLSKANPVHATAGTILGRISQRHSASAEEIAALRRIVEQSRITKPLDADAVRGLPASPLVLDSDERRAVVAGFRQITSSQWGREQQSKLSREQRRRMHAANKKLLEAAAEGRLGGMPSYYLNNY